MNARKDERAVAPVTTWRRTLRDFEWNNVPEDLRLTANEVGVLRAVAEYVDADTMEGTAAHWQVARAARLSVTTVMRLGEALQRKGWILRVASKGRNPTWYGLTYPANQVADDVVSARATASPDDVVSVGQPRQTERPTTSNDGPNHVKRVVQPRRASTSTVVTEVTEVSRQVRAGGRARTHESPPPADVTTTTDHHDDEEAFNRLIDGIDLLPHGRDLALRAWQIDRVGVEGCVRTYRKRHEASPATIQPGLLVRMIKDRDPPAPAPEPDVVQLPRREPCRKCGIGGSYHAADCPVIKNVEAVGSWLAARGISLEPGQPGYLLQADLASAAGLLDDEELRELLRWHSFVRDNNPMEEAK